MSSPSLSPKPGEDEWKPLFAKNASGSRKSRPGVASKSRVSGGCVLIVKMVSPDKDFGAHPFWVRNYDYNVLLLLLFVFFVLIIIPILITVIFYEN